jgi:hypothetical protein
MDPKLDDLDPNSPEYERAMEEAQNAEDLAAGNVEQTEQQDETDPDDPEAVAAAQAAAAVVDPEPKPAADADPQPKVAGVASKDGTRVLPYSALQAERREARHERSARQRAEAELAAAQQQIADLKAGKTPPAEEIDPLSDEALASAAMDVPIVGELGKALRKTREELAELKGKAAPAKTAEPEPEVDIEEVVQEAIDTVPLLSEWQASDPEKFARAKEIDRVTAASPKWKDKPIADRFAYVAKQVADEYDIQTEDPSPPTKSTPSRADPKDVISKVARAAPNTLSDFKGGAVDPHSDRLERMPVQKALARMQNMSDDEIDEHLARLG